MGLHCGRRPICLRAQSASLPGEARAAARAKPEPLRSAGLGGSYPFCTRVGPGHIWHGIRCSVHSRVRNKTVAVCSTKRTAAALSSVLKRGALCPGAGLAVRPRHRPQALLRVRVLHTSAGTDAVRLLAAPNFACAGACPGDRYTQRPVATHTQVSRLLSGRAEFRAPVPAPQQRRRRDAVVAWARIKVFGGAEAATSFDPMRTTNSSAPLTHASMPCRVDTPLGVAH